MGQTGEQQADRDIFNVEKGEINVHNYAPLSAIDVTLDETPPPLLSLAGAIAGAANFGRFGDGTADSGDWGGGLWKICLGDKGV